MQAIFLLVTGNQNVSIGLLSLLLFPGVMIHELSHYLAAKILLVKINKFSLIPKSMKNNTVRLGFVETDQTDIVRDTLIGMAPLLSGMIITGWIAWAKLGLSSIIFSMDATNIQDIFSVIIQMPKQPDFLIWLYLAFAISSTMIPSQTDRHAWLPVGAFLSFVIVLLLISGADDWMKRNVAPYFSQFISILSLVIGFSILIHLTILIPAFLIRILLSKLMNAKIGFVKS